LEEKRFWHDDIETLPLDKLRKLQEDRLKESVDWAYRKTVFYRRLFDEAGVKPADIKTLEDIRKFPFTMDIEVASDGPFEHRLAVPEDEIKMFHSTSGTVGAVIPIPFNQKDLETFMEEGEFRPRWTMGVRPSDVIQILTRFDCCSIGMKEFGASLVLQAAGRYNQDQQIHLTKLAGVTVIEHMPSMILLYFERMKELGIEVKDTRLRQVDGVGEGWAESYKKKVEDKYGIPFMTLWSAVELCPFASAECEARQGLHIFADLGLLEVIDPETGEPLPDGEEGELVVTPFLKQAMPLIRYRVGDIGKILPYEPCACGRSLPKISYVKGRVSHIIKVGDKRVMPIDIEEVIANIEGLGEQHQIILDRPEPERLKLKVEYKPEITKLRALKETAEEGLWNDIGVKSEIELVPQGSIERVTFKAQRLIREYQ